MISAHYPILIDNDLTVWKAWRVRYWPTILLIDKKSVARYYWEGELHPKKAPDKRFAKRIDELLAKNFGVEAEEPKFKGTMVREPAAQGQA